MCGVSVCVCVLIVSVRFVFTGKVYTHVCVCVFHACICMSICVCAFFSMRKIHKFSLALSSLVLNILALFSLHTHTQTKNSKTHIIYTINTHTHKKHLCTNSESFLFVRFFLSLFFRFMLLFFGVFLFN